MKADGTPVGSMAVSGTLASAALGHAAGLTLPFTRTAHGTQSNLDLRYYDRTSLKVGFCAGTVVKSLGANNVNGFHPEDEDDEEEEDDVKALGSKGARGTLLAGPECH